MAYPTTQEIAGHTITHSWGNTSTGLLNATIVAAVFLGIHIVMSVFIFLDLASIARSINSQTGAVTWRYTRTTVFTFAATLFCNLAMFFYTLVWAQPLDDDWTRVGSGIAGMSLAFTMIGYVYLCVERCVILNVQEKWINKYLYALFYFTVPYQLVHGMFVAFLSCEVLTKTQYLYYCNFATPAGLLIDGVLGVLLIRFIRANTRDKALQQALSYGIWTSLVVTTAIDVTTEVMLVMGYGAIANALKCLTHIIRLWFVTRVYIVLRDGYRNTHSTTAITEKNGKPSIWGVTSVRTIRGTALLSTNSFAATATTPKATQAPLLQQGMSKQMTHHDSQSSFASLPRPEQQHSDTQTKSQVGHSYIADDETTGQ